MSKTDTLLYPSIYIGKTNSTKVTFDTEFIGYNKKDKYFQLTAALANKIFAKKKEHCVRVYMILLRSVSN